MKDVNQKRIISKNIKFKEIDLLIFFAHNIKEFNLLYNIYIFCIPKIMCYLVKNFEIFL